MTPRQDHGGKANHADWQPISTAPMDGTRIIVYDKGSWIYDIDIVSVDMQDFKSGGTGFYRATKWMPLPPPPSDSGS